MELPTHPIPYLDSFHATHASHESAGLQDTDAYQSLNSILMFLAGGALLAGLPKQELDIPVAALQCYHQGGVLRAVLRVLVGTGLQQNAHDVQCATARGRKERSGLVLVCCVLLKPRNSPKLGSPSSQQRFSHPREVLVGRSLQQQTHHPRQSGTGRREERALLQGLGLRGSQGCEMALADVLFSVYGKSPHACRTSLCRHQLAAAVGPHQSSCDEPWLSAQDCGLRFPIETRRKAFESNAQSIEEINAIL